MGAAIDGYCYEDETDAGFGIAAKVGPAVGLLIIVPAVANGDGTGYYQFDDNSVLTLWYSTCEMPGGPWPRSQASMLFGEEIGHAHVFAMLIVSTLVIVF